MQQPNAGSTRTRSALIKAVPLCKLHLVATSRSYTCAQDALDFLVCGLLTSH